MTATVGLLNEFGKWLFAHLGRMSIELTILTAIVLIALYALRIKSPALRHLFWGLLLAKPVATFLIASPLSLYAVLWPPAPQMISNPVSMPAPIMEEPLTERPLETIPTMPMPAAAIPTQPSPPPFWHQIDRYGLISLTWIALAGALGLRLLIGCVYVALLRHTAIPQQEGLLNETLTDAARVLKIRRRVRIAKTRVAHGPVLAGILSPIILLPDTIVTALTPKQIKLVVSHELAHARRWDNLVLLIQRLAEMFLFFHPVVWFCGWMMRREAESACDDMVISAYNEADSAVAYADSLTRVAEMRCGITRRLLVNTFAAAESNFASRIRRIMHTQRQRITLRFALATGLTLLLLAALGLPTASLSSSESKKETNETQPPVNNPLNLSGIVVDEAGKPVVDAKIVAQSPQVTTSKFLNQYLLKNSGNTTSDAEGKFSIPLSDPRNAVQNVQLVITHPSFGIATMTSAELLLAGNTLSECRVVMHKRGTVTGKVVDAINNPIKDAEITAILSEKHNGDFSYPPRRIDKSFLSVKTGPDGAYTLDGLPQDAKVILCATHPNYAKGYAGLPDDGWRYGCGITVGATDILVKLQPDAKIEGKVLWEGTRTPVAHVPVVAVQEFASLPGPTEPVETDENGVYSITNLGPGTYEIKILSGNLEGIILPRKVLVEKPGPVTGQDLIVTKGVLIAGKCANANTNATVGEGHIVIQSRQSQYRIEVALNPDGTFQGHVPPGEATIFADIRNAAVSPSNIPIFLVPGHDQKDILFTVKQSMMFKGCVLDPQGKPVAGARVVSRQAPPQLPVITDKEGNFEYALTPSQSLPREPLSIYFEASHPDRPGLRGELYKNAASELDLTGNIKLIPTGSISGRITREKTGEPVAHVSVSATFDVQGRPDFSPLTSHSQTTRTETDDTGNYTLDNLMPGRYNLRVSAAQGETSLTRKIEIAQAAKITGQDFITTKGIRVAGKFITSDTKEPVGGGEVWGFYGGDRRNFSFPVKNDGTFEGYLPPGVINLEARHYKNGFWLQNRDRMTFTLVEGQEKTDIVYEVNPPAVFKGRVVGVDGKPIAGARVVVIPRIGERTPEGDRPHIADQQGLFDVLLPAHAITQPNTPYSLMLEASHPDLPDRRGILTKTISSNTDLTGDIVIIPMGSVQGKITWEGTGKPAAQMVVSVVSEVPTQRNYQLETSNGAITDETGVFNIKKLMPGKYLLKTVTPKEGFLIPRTFEVAQGEQKSLQDLTVLKGSRIAGKIINAKTQESIGGGTVRANSANYSTTIEVKADGTFEGFMPFGNVTLQASSLDGFISPAQTFKTITLVAGQDQNDIILELKQPPMLKGRVLDPEGKPVAEAKIVTNRRHIDQMAAIFISNQNGLFQIPLSGDYSTLYITHPDKPELRAFFQITAKNEEDQTADITLVPTGIIQGKVAWEGTGAPVPGVSVSAISARDAFQDPIRMETDEKGDFSFNYLLPGKYTLTVMTNEGIAPSRVVEVTQGSKTTDQNLMVSRGVLVTVKFVKAGTSEVVRGGQITVRSKNNANSNRPFDRDISLDENPEGVFVKRMLPDEVTFSASHKTSRVIQPQQTVTLIAGQDQANIVFETDQELTFKGHTLDVEGKPLEGVNVSLINAENEKTTVSTQKGLFELALPPRYDLQRDQQIILEALHPDKPDLRGVLITKLNSETDLTSDITLIPTGTLQGKVAWEGTGVPLAHLLIEAVPEEGTPMRYFGKVNDAETDEAGNFLLKGLMPGKYTLRHNGSIDGAVTPRNVTVTQAVNLSGQDLVAVKGVRIAGRFVKAGTKEPVPGLTAHVYAESAQHAVVQFEIKPDGSFEGCMPPGETTVHATIYSMSMQQEQPPKKLILVAGQDQTDIVFEVKPDLVFKGRVLGTDGKPIAGAQIVSNTLGEGKQYVSNQEGRFELSLPSGLMAPIDLKVSHPDKPGFQGLLMKTLKTEADLTGDIVLGPVGTIRGRVVDSAKKPIPSAKIMIEISTKTSGRREGSVACDALGQFEIKTAVSNVLYTLTASAEKYTHAHVEQVMDQPGKVWEVGELVLLPAVKSIDGTVKDETGKPVAGARVSIFDSAAGSREVLSDDKGHYLLENLVEERIEVSAWYTRDKTKLAAHTTVMGGATNVDLILKPEGK